MSDSSGHVFHPGHEELHGVTVVVEGASGRTYVGRYHERSDRGVVMHDVAIYEPGATSYGREEWLARQRKFGVQAAHRHLIVPGDEVRDLTRFSS